MNQFFKTDISQSSYVTNWYWNEIKKFSKNNTFQSEFCMNTSLVFNSISNIKTIEDARESLLMLNIYYSDLAYTYISESPQWTLITLLSNFGGQLGNFYMFIFF